MERLSEYLQTLISKSGFELHLEPNTNPSILSAEGSLEIAKTPLLGTQISSMIFPLIPLSVRKQLPNKSEVEFRYTHPLGNFLFLVKKSSFGFVVTIRPTFSSNTQDLTAAANTLKEVLEKPFSSPVQNQTPVTTHTSPIETPKIQDFTNGSLDSTSPQSVSASQPIENKLSDNIFAPEIILEEFANSLPEAKQPATNGVSNIPETPNFNSGDLFINQEISNGSNQNDYSKSSLNNFHTNPPSSNNYSEPDVANQNIYSPPQVSAYENIPTETSYQTPTIETPVIYPQTSEYVPPQNQFTQQQMTYSQPQTVVSAQPMIMPETPVIETKSDYFSPIAEQNTGYVPTSETFRSAEVNQVSAESESKAKIRMDEMFAQMAQFGASDLHLCVSMPPMVRKDGKMMPLPCNETVLKAQDCRELLTSIMPEKNRKEFAQRNDTDFAYEIPELARFRANIFADRKGWGGVFRIIPTKILTAEQLGLSQAIMNLCDLSKGLVVVTGPTGSGKSTTLCAMIDSINKKREEHIITIEDPIEFTHENQKCLVNQREVHNHTDSFKNALRAALREDPDILLVGEMRDLETISIAIETAETGHLVFGTLHTTTAASTVDRIIDQFPADRQQQIRVMLSESLKGVISQTLLPKKGGGRVAALEVLIVTPAISNLIREGKTFQIPSAMQTGKNMGMVMLNDALFELVSKGLVEPRDAYIKAVDKVGFESIMQRNGIKI